MHKDQQWDLKQQWDEWVSRAQVTLVVNFSWNVLSVAGETAIIVTKVASQVG